MVRLRTASGKELENLFGAFECTFDVSVDGGFGETFDPED